MAGDLQVKRVNTLRAYMECIEGLMVPDVPLWFRGVGNESRPLMPSLYRHPSNGAVDFADLETRLLRRFRERSIPYQTSPWGVDDVWEMLFVMQHFGVPTRLLDWTENPYIGLFFALTSAEVDHNTHVAKKAAAVWVLKPEAWNRYALADITYSGEILSVDSESLKSYAPDPDWSNMRKLPVALYGLHNSPRIVAQRGVFTMFGTYTGSMHEAYANSACEEGTLVKIIIPRTKIWDLRHNLFRIGFTDSVVYPDLPGLASEMKREFGFVI